MERVPLEDWLREAGKGFELIEDARTGGWNVWVTNGYDIDHPSWVGSLVATCPGWMEAELVMEALKRMAGTDG